MKTIFRLSVFAAAALAASAAAGPVPGVWTEDWEGAAGEAFTNGVPMLVYFSGSDWCPNCERLERDVFSSEAWKEWVSTNLYLAQVDFPNEAERQSPRRRALNRALADRFGVEAFPTLVLFSSAFEELGRPAVRGGSPPAFYIRQIAVALAEADRAKLEAVLGAEETERYLALKAAVDAYEELVSAKARRIDAEADRLKAALAAAPDREARAAAQAELNRVLTELVTDYRGVQERELPAVREKAAALERLRDAIAGPAGTLPRTDR